ncbi:SDR family NAD(P)-dependent oxidoreductase [Actinomycetospora termitidis]|uniref:SDR family NAD(P)-dependent oxidoreductase n=1 Tax=Actinomycetospora termitidis TaxID=3053470 RepID=A0ABT7MAD4_9PSEU|nr:SDR family NAD(P)-dependent oxidoreductase [Actinomycetospora sp. Odt1-22]MDL5157169.1 SDR family NAD(P)-dependent oxidoreductase [Actinomycetospora sp. Odt1-22]
MPRTVAITGATDGLGRALALDLAARDVRLVLHGRSEERLDELAAEVGRQAAHPPLTVWADLADLGQVARAADEVAERAGELHVLVNNAGIGTGEPDGRQRSTSRDGYELRFAVNYLATFLLTEKLLPVLRASASGTASRVVHVASLGQAPLDFDDLMLERSYDGGRAYGQSKLAQILHVVDLAERLPAAEVTANALHPGTYMPTKIVLDEIGRSVDTLESGVAATRRLVLDPAVEGVSGRFYDRQSETRPNAQAADPEARATLRARSLELVGAHL